MNSVEGPLRNTTLPRFFVGEKVTRIRAGGSGEALWPVLDRARAGAPEVVAEFVSRADAETLARVLAARSA